jgi:NAD(P)-dependent dehydrogenase (short-subunit alcohol dehydrogenase family)
VLLVGHQSRKAVKMAKTILITGCSRGIGHEIARQLAADGHAVIATARNPAILEREFGDRARVFSLDVNDPTSVRDLARRVDGPIDVLINNAGVLLDADSDFATVSLDKINESLAVNALSAMRVTQAFLPHLEKGTKPVVANITSLMGSIADNKSGGYYGYRMSKAALNMFTKSFAIDYPEITAICLHPGWVQTDMGGGEAPTPAAESAKGLINVILKAKKSQSGCFLNFKGQEMPW